MLQMATSCCIGFQWPEQAILALPVGAVPLGTFKDRVLEQRSALVAAFLARVNLVPFYELSFRASRASASATTGSLFDGMRSIGSHVLLRVGLLPLPAAAFRRDAFNPFSFCDGLLLFPADRVVILDGPSPAGLHDVPSNRGSVLRARTMRQRRQRNNPRRISVATKE